VLVTKPADRTPNFSFVEEIDDLFVGKSLFMGISSYS